MSVLFDKEVPKDTNGHLFTVVLEKYKDVVIVNSVDVDKDDDTLLLVDYDHNIDAPPDEVADELGRVLLAKLEEGIASIEKDELKVEK